jgi:hypothetical protein
MLRKTPDERSAILRAFAPRVNETKGDRPARQLWLIGNVLLIAVQWQAR